MHHNSNPPSSRRLLHCRRVSGLHTTGRCLIHIMRCDAVAATASASRVATAVVAEVVYIPNVTKISHTKRMQYYMKIYVSKNNYV